MCQCTLCMKGGGLTLCTNYENTDVIRFLCKKFKIDFENSFGCEDPLNPLYLIIPLCPDCHEVLAQLKKVQVALKETKVRLDQILTEIKDNVRLAPIHNLQSQTDLDPIVEKNGGILRAEILRVTSVRFEGIPSLKTIESAAEPSTFIETEAWNSCNECPAEDVKIKEEFESHEEENEYTVYDGLEEEDVETFDDNLNSFKEEEGTNTSKVTVEESFDGSISNEPSTSQHEPNKKHKRKADPPKTTTTPSNVVIYKCDLCHSESLEFLGVRSLKFHAEKIHKSAKILYFCSELNCNKQFPLKILYEKHMEFHAEKLTKKRFTCDHCEMRFTFSRDWKSHFNSRTHNGTLEPRTRTHPQCRFCTMQTVYAERFRDHEVKEHQDKLIYSCGKCEEKFSSAIILDSHVQSHNLNGPYKCLICQNQYEHGNELNYHLAIRHIPLYKGVSTESVFNITDTTCAICGRYYSTPEKFSNHFSHNHRASKSKSLHCEICADKKFVCVKTLLSHLIHSHESGEKKLTCSQCSKKFATNYMLERHVQNHTLDASKPLACELCDERFKLDDEVGLEKHQKSGHKQFKKAKMPCTANNCDMEFHNRVCLTTHQRKNHPELFIYSCLLCSKNYCVEKFLETHMNTHAEAGKIGPFDCCVCKNQYSTSNALADHLVMHTGENKLQCTKCSKTYRYKAGLKEHMITNHGEQKPYRCETCGKRYASKSKLNSHMLSHKDPAELLKTNPKTCKTCGLQFSRAFQLTHHLRQHKPDKPKIVKVHVCEICGKSVSHLKGHMSTHIGEKRHICYFCDKRFVRWDVLKSHMYTHTGEKPFECHICNSEFNQPSSLRGHIKNIHKKDGTFFEKPGTAGTLSNSNDSGNDKTTMEPEPGPSPQIDNLNRIGSCDQGGIKLKDGESLDFDVLMG